MFQYFNVSTFQSFNVSTFQCFNISIFQCLVTLIHITNSAPAYKPEKNLYKGATIDACMNSPRSSISLTFSCGKV